jgi:MFS family permease
MPAKRNLQLVTPYLVCTLEGVSHGFYLLWLTVHKGISPVAAAGAIAAGDLALLALDVPTGIFADRLGARRSLVLGSVFQVLGLVLFWKAGSVVAVVAAVLAIALGDAFRHGADQALVYRSCAALGEAATCGRRFSGAQAWALSAMVGLTALGGFLAQHAGFDAAWALEVGLALAGLALALAMRDLPAAPDERDALHDDEDGDGTSFAALRARVPWALVVPATVAVTLGSVGELLLQTTPRAGLDTQIVALAVAGALALEALGAALVARGLVPLCAPVLEGVGLAALAGLGLVALSPALLLPGVLLIFVGVGVAPAVRSALVQEGARDGERATVASAASTVDMLGKTAGLPLAAWLHARFQLPATVAVLGAAALALWGLAIRRARVR